jgi:hypothetical protein
LPHVIRLPAGPEAYEPIPRPRRPRSTGSRWSSLRSRIGHRWNLLGSYRTHVGTSIRGHTRERRLNSTGLNAATLGDTPLLVNSFLQELLDSSTATPSDAGVGMNCCLLPSSQMRLDPVVLLMSCMQALEYRIGTGLKEEG